MVKVLLFSDLSQITFINVNTTEFKNYQAALSDGFEGTMDDYTVQTFEQGPRSGYQGGQLVDHGPAGVRQGYNGEGPKTGPKAKGAGVQMTQKAAEKIRETLRMVDDLERYTDSLNIGTKMLKKSEIC